MATASEAKMDAAYLNKQEAVPLIVTLTELGHPQPATPLVTDNQTAKGIANNSVKQKRSKAMDMRFYWLRDRIAQGQFFMFWQPGKFNLADYFTKFHPIAHHKRMREFYLSN